MPDDPTRTITLLDDDTIEWHDLVVRPEDGEFVVGNIATGEFVAVPDTGAEIIRLYQEGLTTAQVRSDVSRRLGAEVDLEDFVQSLSELGLVKRIGAHDFPCDPAPPSPPNQIRPQIVAWLFSWPAYAAYGVLIAAAGLAILFRPGLFPTYQNFFWIPETGILLLFNLVFFFSIGGFHELAHYIAARSLGLPAKIGLSTRLDDLALVTRVPALWAVDRHRRYRVYLAGILFQMVLASLLVLLIDLTALPAFWRALAEALVLQMLLMLLVQGLLYMRTDIYYVFMEALRCRDLFDDSIRLLRSRLAGIRSILRHSRAGNSERTPISNLPAREQRVVRWYTGAIVIGSTITLSVSLYYWIPILYVTFKDLFVEVFEGLWGRGGTAALADGATGIGVLCVLFGLYLRSFILTHPHGIASFRRWMMGQSG